MVKFYCFLPRRPGRFAGQVPCNTKNDVPFVITLEPSTGDAVCQAVNEMSTLDFLLEPPLALVMEPPL